MSKSPVSRRNLQTDPPLVHQMGSRQYFSADDCRKIYEDFLFGRAIQAYMMTLPILNTIGMRDGSEATFGRGRGMRPRGSRFATR